MRKAAIALLILAAVCVALLVGARVHEARTGARPAAETRAPRPSVDATLTLRDAPVDAILVGGGVEPESSGVQLEQDIVLASRVLSQNRYVLFGPGSGPLAVRTNARAPREPDAARALLAELFDPRDRGASYRRTSVALDAPATKANLVRALASQTERPGPKLTLFVAAHGTEAEDPIDSTFDLWSGDTFSVRDLADVFLSTERPVVAVITSCHGGAFADTALETETPVVSCGLFATLADRVASGCDADPERSAQEGFALHFFAALLGTDRAGDALPPGSLDLDHDGRVSYLEAHARARVAALGFDVPTTTSERLLRALTVDRDIDGVAPAADVVEDFVISTLGAALGARELPIARAMLSRIGDELAAIDSEVADAETRRDEAFRRLRIALLERWPMLDDPWHPEHAQTLAREGEAIVALLTARPELRVYREEGDRLAELDAAFDQKLIEESRVLRLVRAMENVRMLALVRGLGGTGLARYDAVRACELGP